MPEPVQRGARYMPGLDGLRAIAVLGVIAFHLEWDWAQGGLLGVGVFFTLSGYLITDILLNQVRKGGIKFVPFWLARARRLLPALFAVLIIVTAWVTVIGPHQPGDFRAGVLSAAGYVNNWWQILHDVSYFARFEAPSPFKHLWSLSIEEQFYIVWPFLLLAGTKLISEAKGGSALRPRLAVVTFVLALASAVLMAVLYQPSLDPSRVYYGTDTRAQELLIGAALAMVWPSRQLRPQIRPQARRTIEIAGLLGLAIIVVMYWQSNEFDPFLYRGGFTLLAIGTALAVASLAHPASRLGPVIGCKPLRWIGERSYGIYLWHFPVIVLTTPSGPHEASIARSLFQVALTLAIAELSWRFLENPIRHGALGRLWQRLRAARSFWEVVPKTGWTYAGAAAIALLLVFALAGMAGVGVSDQEAVGSQLVSKTVKHEKKITAADANRTICEAVVHIGDSTSEGLVSSEYLPDPKELISAQYARVGAPVVHLQVSGARSIYEQFEGLPNAQEVAEAEKNEGFKGCWVVAMGTNEAANVAAGSTIDYDERIESMMSTIGDEPVMWVNVKSLLKSSPYAESGMKAWDEALLEACDRNPEMRVYDWADEVKDAWFVEDGIHFTSEGYAARGRMIADALRNAFPASEDPPKMTDSDDCTVHS